MAKTHVYPVQLDWTGNLGTGTSDYRAYDRANSLSAAGKPAIAGSADPAFRGDPGRWNPEELLVGALAACHQLWYLHLCATAGIVVTAYRDEASGTMVEAADGSGHFSAATLRPIVTIAPGSDADTARRLHADAARFCFIARSVAFPVDHEPVIRIGE
jgi:organic hydroperoxide reductase OsmC/OhrA